MAGYFETAARRDLDGWAAVVGREHSMATGCFQESKFHWPLSGNEFEERTVSSRPKAEAGQFEKQTYNAGNNLPDKSKRSAAVGDGQIDLLGMQSSQVHAELSTVLLYGPLLRRQRR